MVFNSDARLNFGFQISENPAEDPNPARRDGGTSTGGTVDDIVLHVWYIVTLLINNDMANVDIMLIQC